MCIIQIGILGLRKVFANSKGIAVVTQPLTAIMNEKLKSHLVKTAVLSMRGKLKKEEGNEDEVELSCLEDEVLDGKFPVVIGHPESWGSNRGQKLLLELKKRQMVLMVGIDEFHQGQVGHWEEFRPNMMKIIGRLRIFRVTGAPCLAMSATATSEEVSATISNLGFRTVPVLLQASPTQQNIKLVKIKRPSNNNGPDGYIDKRGVKLPGFLAPLERIYLLEFIKCIREGRCVKKGIIFCR
jgi:superfamily II DNA helicase RecQ